MGPLCSWDSSGGRACSSRSECPDRHREQVAPSSRALQLGENILLGEIILVDRVVSPEVPCRLVWDAEPWLPCLL